MPWWLWVLLGVLALAGETASMALFLLYVGAAAFVAAVLALVGLSAVAQLVVFLVIAVLLIVLVRPHMLQALAGRVPHRILTNHGPLVDRLGTVTQTVTPDSGMIRVGNAEFWTARVNPPERRIEVGQSVRIVYVTGLTAFVEPVVAPEALPEPGALPTGEMAREEK